MLPTIPNSSSPRFWQWTELLFAAIFLTLVIFALPDFGASWDEQVRYDDGLRKWAYYVDVFHGKFSTPPGGHYPGLYDLTHVALVHLTGDNAILVGHALTAFFGLLGIWAIRSTGKQLIGSAGGLIAVLVLLFGFPRFSAHLFINPKDIPFFAGYALSLSVLVRIVLRGGLTWPLALAWGGATGIALGVRLGGLILWGYAGIVVLFWIGKSLRQGKSWRQVMSQWKGPIFHFAAGAILSIVILFLVWPTMHAGFLSKTATSLQAIQSFKWDLFVLFDGAFFKAADLPFYYLPWMLVITTALPLVLLLVAGSAWAGRNLARGRVGWTKKNGAIGLLAFAALFPVLYILFSGATVYNGTRHILFILAPTAVLGAVILHHLGSALRQRGNLWVILGAVFVGLSLIPSVGALSRLHPYQYIYYNYLVGGTRGAAGNYELDYWATACRAAMEQLVAHLDEEPGNAGKSWILGTEHVRWLLEPHAPGDRAYSLTVARPSGPNADFYLACTIWGSENYYAGEAIVEIRRDGQLLAVVKDRRKLTGEEREMFYGQPSNEGE